MTVTVGMRVPYGLFQQEPGPLRKCVQRAERADIDRLTVGDHVTFREGIGFDGLLQTAILGALTTQMDVQTAVYLLALRHPVPAARQIATVGNIAPGRFVLGVGVGGEDPHEFRACGVDPSTRGQRLDESLSIVRRLLAGDVVTHKGRHFELDNVQIAPTPSSPLRIIIGGRSEAALRRTALNGDGWLGLFVSPERYAECTRTLEEIAHDERRSHVEWQHGMHFWCSFDNSPDGLAAAMEELYGIPFSRFERYAPWGPPADMAARLRPYIHSGARHLNLAPVAATYEEAVDGVAEVRRLLNEAQ
jgi:alkanesulfonate monooxygenase SsuD/methylene tetrahydromethanopterin reductase-like flavin-dependent oxidoreductase (luciferase family)